MLLFVSASLSLAVFLLPSGKISKPAKSVLSVLMTFCVISPLFGVIGRSGQKIDPSELFPRISVPKMSENGQYLADEACRRINDVLGEIIRSKTKNPFDITISVDIGEDFIIDIKHVTVFFQSRPGNLEDIALTLEKELGFMPEFKVTENEKS